MAKLLHGDHCRDISDGRHCYELPLGDRPVFRQRTERVVPVPSRRDALGQHLVARVTARAGYTARPPYRPEAS